MTAQPKGALPKVQAGPGERTSDGLEVRPVMGMAAGSGSWGGGGGCGGGGGGRVRGGGDR
jgi:hypothetical protein